MTLDQLLDCCLAKPGAWTDRPFGDEWLRQYPEDATVMANLGRSGWNSLRLRGAIPDLELREALTRRTS